MLTIDVQHLKKSFNGKPAVVDISLKVAQGEIFGFMGPNGGGKTTTIRMLCGLLTPSGGSGTCLGFDILTQSQEIKKNIGYMTQQFSLYDELTVRENLNFMAQLYGIEKPNFVIDQNLDEIGLKDRANQIVRTLSGGWKQRLSLAAALLHNPKLLLLDEPTAGVDPRARKEFWDHIHLLSTRGITTLVSTHYMDEAERCNHLAYISAGLILITGTKNEIVNNSGLTTWEVSDTDVKSLVPKLTASPNIDQVNVYENIAHVSGHDAILLEQDIRQFMVEPYKWKKIPPNLEDVFVFLVGKEGKKND